ncbi:hypothetical protein JG687_00010630 [Phytophthora cactorum]|uniref:RxLR effector protein n=1 Tax=Phytophthora cactorum TaxID=29920 RepID=A0A329S410_9STRA|nr:hypothetical protein GQ600_24276 [Phytophthora cactorum]KAG2773547.1 hypothetical protein Pcac1_g15599 [Phytophthora cactorum]KAG2806738.1 hypothetical protein PC112_g17719 [Phytophthora cactorum]KAG2808201.1 hypothetical protein PC111_g16603 [Phytophthora cactorum]KAG2828746.1 hypothetical protein PC113_g21412 [Phytophthora cactorum]
MAGPQLRFATLLLLLVAVACVGSVSAEAPLAPETRLLRQQVHQSVDSVTQTAIIESSSNSTSGSGSGPEQTSATINTAASAAESTGTHHEGPTLMSFVGPTIAGVLAIVLIGAVVTFKNRMGK